MSTTDVRRDTGRDDGPVRSGHGDGYLKRAVHSSLGWALAGLAAPESVRGGASPAGRAERRARCQGKLLMRAGRAVRPQTGGRKPSPPRASDQLCRE